MSVVLNNSVPFLRFGEKNMIYEAASSLFCAEQIRLIRV